MSDTVEESLLQVVRGGLEASSMMPLIRALHSAGKLDLLAPRGEGHKSFLFGWISSAKYGTLPSVENLLELGVADARLWGFRGENGDSLISTIWQRAMEETSDAVESLDRLLSCAIGMVPLEEAIKSSSRKSSPGKGSGEERVLTLARCLDAGLYESALVLARDKGCRLDGVREDGSYVASKIGTVDLWDCFLLQKGDPFARSKDGVVVWERVFNSWKSSYEKKHKDLAGVVLAWVDRHDKSKVQDFELQEYWKSIRRHGGERCLKSRHDWPVLQDEMGRTPMMVLLAASGKNFKSFCNVEKVKKGIHLLDSKGAGIWVYALSKGEDLPDGAVRWMIRSGVKMVKDRQGWGVLRQILMGDEPKNGVFVEHDENRLAEYIASDHESFWGDLAGQEVLAQWMLKDWAWRMHYRSGDFIAKMTSCIPPDELEKMHPELLGCVAVMAILKDSSTHVSGGGESSVGLNVVAQRLVDAGACLEKEQQESIVERLMKPRGSATVFTPPRREVENMLAPLAREFEKNEIAMESMPQSATATIRKRI